MEFRDTPEEAAFRSEVRQFIQEHLPERLDEPDLEMHRFIGRKHPGSAAIQRWRKAILDRGWLAAHWPTEYGGGGLSAIEQFILNEEMARHRAPANFGGLGVTHFGPTLIIHGTDEQKAEFLPRITRGEIVFCQGWSEPGAGSDLASLQTRAVRDGDDYVVNGQKIWTTGAHFADWMYMLARTDPDAPKHRGISILMFPMDTPGVTVRPLPNLAGHHGFNEVFLEDVRAPAKFRIGEENRGWYVATTLLDFERSGVAGSVAMQQQVNDLTDFVKRSNGTGVTRLDRHPELWLELADRAVEAEVALLFSYRIITMQKSGQVPNYEASMFKLFRSESEQRFSRTAMKITGLYGPLKGGHIAPMDGDIAHGYLSSLSGTIGAGTSEIQRNIIAQRGLGMPRG